LEFVAATSIFSGILKTVDVETGKPPCPVKKKRIEIYLRKKKMNCDGYAETRRKWPER
jgi:hypothetical protein